jgi:hypothetical protein
VGFAATGSGNVHPMLAVALVLLAIGLLGLFIFPWGGILAGIVGLALLGFYLLGAGRRAADAG